MTTTQLTSDNYLTHRRGLMSWLFSLDHKRIAIMYMVAILVSFFLGGFFAIVLRTMLLKPMAAGNTRAFELYNHIFTLHGAVMVFMFVIPAIPAIMGNFVLPMMLGAKDVAFPRVNLLGFHLYAIGGLFFLYILVGGVIQTAFNIHLPGGLGLDTGWTFYTPYSTTKSSSAVVPATLGAFIMGFSSILTGVNFIASIHMLRPRGMTWFKMPLFLWSLYATSILQIFATPVLAVTLLLLAAERVLRVGIFDPALGGDPILYQHFFWFYSHPAVYIMILPAMGVISELISVFSRKHIFGYKAIAYSSVAIAILSFLVWGHHMFVSGMSSLSAAIFSLLTFSVSIPSAVKVFNWLATLYRGDIRLKTPMVYALGFIILFTAGGLTGLFLGSIATDVHLTNTYFIVAHFHYVMMGSTLFAFLGGMYYWWPKMFGRMYSERWGVIAAILVFVGFNVTFFVQFVAGTRGMPRRYASYPVQYTAFHRVSTFGSYIMAAGLVIVGLNWVHSLRRGRRAAPNPWGANSLEWQTTSPPPHDNFSADPVTEDNLPNLHQPQLSAGVAQLNYAAPPIVGDPYDFTAWHYIPEIDGWTRDFPNQSSNPPQAS